jgi:predicted amidohydrolase
MVEVAKKYDLLYNQPVLLDQQGQVLQEIRELHLFQVILEHLQVQSHLKLQFVLERLVGL